MGKSIKVILSKKVWVGLDFVVVISDYVDKFLGFLGMDCGQGG
jgi:hypothetical protein